MTKLSDLTPNQQRTLRYLRDTSEWNARLLSLSKAMSAVSLRNRGLVGSHYLRDGGTSWYLTRDGRDVLDAESES